MKAMGFRWDEERRTWTRRPPDMKKPPKPLRSGMRLLKLNGASPDERAAAEVFMERLRTARKASFRDTDTSTKLSKFLKYCLSQPATLPVFAVACVGLGAAAGTGAELGGIDATTLTCGLAAGVPVAAARVAAHKASAGSEPPDGRALERSIVDAATGSYAIPAPHDWRATEGPWKAGTIGLAAIADVPRVALLHGRIQPFSCRSRATSGWASRAPRPSRRRSLSSQRRSATSTTNCPTCRGMVASTTAKKSSARRLHDSRRARAPSSRRPTTPTLRRSKPRTYHAPPTPGRRLTTPPPPAVRAARTAVERDRGRGVGVRRRFAAAWLASCVRPSRVVSLSTRTRMAVRGLISSAIADPCRVHNGRLRR